MLNLNPEKYLSIDGFLTSLPDQIAYVHYVLIFVNYYFASYSGENIPLS